MNDPTKRVHELLTEIEPYASQVVETQLVDYGETAAGGPFVKFRLPAPSDLDPYRGRERSSKTKQGTRFVLMAFEVQDDESIAAPGGYPESAVEHQDRGLEGASKELPTASRKPAKGPHGEFAKHLKLSDFFLAPQVLKVLGTDAEYQDWCRRKKCSVCGAAEWVERLGEWRCEYAHVRRAGESGTAYKAEFWGVPLCHDCHRNHQHQSGELDLLSNKLGPYFDQQSAKDWFNAQRAELVSEWGWERLREVLGVDSMTQVPPEVFLEWAFDHALGPMVPRKIRDMAEVTA